MLTHLRRCKKFYHECIEHLFAVKTIKKYFSNQLQLVAATLCYSKYTLRYGLIWPTLHILTRNFAVENNTAGTFKSKQIKFIKQQRARRLLQVAKTFDRHKTNKCYMHTLLITRDVAFLFIYFLK